MVHKLKKRGKKIVILNFHIHSDKKMFSKALSLSTSAVLLPPLLFLVGVSSGKGVHHIKNAEDLIQFSKNVSSGTNYSGTTVFLDADINLSDGLSEQFGPIGTDSNHNFQGTFDGQGHTISNLAMNSSSLQHVGLLGHSKGTTTIRNVVLDSSCSVMSSYRAQAGV